MLIYVNGDSHSAGAELVEDFCFAMDDRRYIHLGRTPHPEAIPYTFGYFLSQSLNAGYFLDAESAGSNQRILRTTNTFLEEKYSSKTVIVIGWSTWEREEWLHNHLYYQVTASGTDSVPQDLVDKYKQWVTEQTQQELAKKQRYWHNKIYEFHLDLQSKNISHLFFNSYNHFNMSDADKFDWQNCYINPYEDAGTYFNWCKEHGFNTVNKGLHYGRDAQIAWGNYLLPWLTNTNQSSIIQAVKVNPNQRVKFGPTRTG